VTRRRFPLPTIVLFLFSAILGGLLLGTGLATVRFDTLATDAELFGVASADEDTRFPALPPADGPQPRVVVEGGETYDFGTVESGVLQRHGFVFKNVGQYPLRLKQGTTTCKCTISNLETEEIAPGKSAVVTLEWEVKGTLDQYRQVASIYTSDRLQRIVVLTITGQRQSSVYARPPSLQFSKSQAESVSREATIHSSQPDTKIVSVELTDPVTAEQFELTCEPLELQGDEKPDVKSVFLVRVTVKPGLPLGPVQQTIRVTTDVQGVAPIEIPLTGTVDSDISIIGGGWNKGVLRLGVLKGNVKTERKLLLNVKGPLRDEVEFTVDAVDPAQLVASVGEAMTSKDGKVRQFPLAITVPADCPAVNRLGTVQGSFGEVRLKTTHPTQPELVIRVQFAVEG
jgi:Protein of unknown function (DUF1573)